MDLYGEVKEKNTYYSRSFNASQVERVVSGIYIGRKEAEFAEVKKLGWEGYTEPVEKYGIYYHYTPMDRVAFAVDHFRKTDGKFLGSSFVKITIVEGDVDADDCRPLWGEERYDDGTLGLGQKTGPLVENEMTIAELIETSPGVEILPLYSRLRNGEKHDSNRPTDIFEVEDKSFVEYSDLSQYSCLEAAYHMASERLGRNPHWQLCGIQGRDVNNLRKPNVKDYGDYFLEGALIEQIHDEESDRAQTVIGLGYKFISAEKQSALRQWNSKSTSEFLSLRDSGMFKSTSLCTVIHVSVTDSVSCKMEFLTEKPARIPGAPVRKLDDWSLVHPYPTRKTLTTEMTMKALEE